MIIWCRFGIIALIIPGLFICAAESFVKPSEPEAPKQGERFKKYEDPDRPTRVKDETARIEKENEARKAIQRSKDNAFGIGSVLAAVVLLPLGWWMNRKELRMMFDEHSGEPVPVETGGGHTLFFIPVEYWAFIWMFMGLWKFMT